MIKIATHTLMHRHFVGGVGLATLAIRKRRTVECSNMESGEGPQKETKRDLKGTLCNTCESCQHRGCYFAFQRYPYCYLPR